MTDTTQPPMTRAEIAAARERLSEEMSFGKMLHSVGALPRALDTLEQALEVLAGIVHDADGWEINGGDDYYVAAGLIVLAREFLQQVEGVPDGKQI